MRWNLILAFAALVALFVVPSTSQADCARQFPVLTLATPTDAPLPADASLIAMVTSSWSRSSLVKPGSDTMTPPRDFWLEREGVSIALTAEDLGPGLLRLRPERAPEPGRWTVHGLHELAEVEFSAAVMPEAPTAPRVTALEHRVGKRRRWDRERTTHVTVAEPLGESTMLIVGIWAEGSGAYQAVTDVTTLSHIVYRGPGSCGVVADGVMPPIEAKPAKLFVIDRYGQSSALSEPVLSSFKDTGE